MDENKAFKSTFQQNNFVVPGHSTMADSRCCSEKRIYAKKYGIFPVKVLKCCQSARC